MKKNMIALLLSIVMTVGSISGTPVLAAETTSEETVTIEEAVEEATEISEDEYTAESLEVIEEDPSQDATESVEEAETTEVIEDPEEEESADIADTSSEAEEVEEPAVDSEEVETENEVKDAAFEDVEDIVDSGECGESVTWTLTGTDDNLTLTISGSGEMLNFSKSDIPWAPERARIKTVIIEDGVTSIGDYAFYDLNIVTNISLGCNVTSIGYGAFEKCFQLTHISIPESVISIGGEAFRDCISLTNIEIPDSVTSIGNRAFNNCKRLTSVTIPNGVTSIYSFTFCECNNLESITIPDSVTNIEYHAFYNCTSLTSIAIPNSVTSIGFGAFYNCRSLTNIAIPDSVTSIESNTFDSCISLVDITIPNSVKIIGDYAFYNCSSLSGITIPDSLICIGKLAFGKIDTQTSICFRGTKDQWDTAVGNNEVYYKSIVYNYFSVDADFELSGTSFNYTGKPIKPAVTVTYNGQQLIEGTDYELVYKNNTNAGKASVDINGIGNYSGTATKTFTIKKAPNTITAKSFTRTYSTKAQTFDLGVKIKNGTPTYTSNSKSVTVSKAGKVTVKAKFIGKATITITAQEKTNYSKQTKKITITVNPTKTALSSVTSPSAGKMTVKWKKNAVGNGYQIQYSTSSKFTSPKTVSITKNTTLSKTIGSLAKGKKYYVRIRTYKTVGKTKFYSGWSAAKAVTIKK